MSYKVCSNDDPRWACIRPVRFVLACYIRVMGLTKFAQMMILGWAITCG